MPKVSIIVPNYNHARFLPKRIDSILVQTFQNFELILLDDCSTDDSRSILSEYASDSRDSRIRLEFNTENSGSPFKQWNKGVRLALGEYVWIAESDDYADPRFLERLVAVLDADPGNAFVYCRSWQVSPDGRTGEFIDPELPEAVRRRWAEDYTADGSAECRDYMTLCNTVPNASAVLFRKAIYEDVGGADETLQLCGDWKLWVSMAMQRRMAYIAEPLNYYRFHDASVRTRSKLSGVWNAEGSQVGRWIRNQIDFPAEYWVPLLLSSYLPISAKRKILRRAWEVDPHPIRSALRAAFRKICRQLLWHCRQLGSVVRNAGRLDSSDG